MVSLTAVVWIAIAAWMVVALIAYAIIKIGSDFDRRFPPVQIKTRKPRAKKIDTGRRDDEAP